MLISTSIAVIEESNNFFISFVSDSRVLDDSAAGWITRPLDHVVKKANEVLVCPRKPLSYRYVIIRGDYQKDSRLVGRNRRSSVNEKVPCPMPLALCPLRSTPLTTALVLFRCAAASFVGSSLRVCHVATWSNVVEWRKGSAGMRRRHNDLIIGAKEDVAMSDNLQLRLIIGASRIPPYRVILYRG
uniref:Uncharacterized protein n=1 Tax=Setaria digitata TaxID=48799 RepID=A0A915PKH9_9BILA